MFAEIALVKWFRKHVTARRGVYSDTTQLNSTELKMTQLNSVQPSQSCFCLRRHDLQLGHYVH